MRRIGGWTMRALLKADRIIKDKGGETAPPTTGNSQIAHLQPTVSQIKLSTITLEPFAGNIETWARFWEQFEFSVDKIQSVTTINNHIFFAVI
jgi:hypothetical protein